MQQRLVGEVIRSAARRVPARLAVAHDGRKLKYAQVEDQASHLASVLTARGGDGVVW